MGALAATVVSALLYPLAFPPVAFWPLAWVALAPFLVAVRRVRWWTGALLAWLWALVVAASVIDWLPQAVATYYRQPLWVGAGVFLVAATLMGAIEYAAFAVWYRCTEWPRGWARPLVVGAAWVAAELGRGTLLTGNPWALVGYSQVPVLSLVQIADVAGVYGPSFLVAAANAALVELWFARIDGTPAARRRAWGGVGAVAALVLVVVAYGRVRLSQELDAGPATPVAVVQSNVEVVTQWEPGVQRANLDTHLALTRVVRGQGTPRIVFWPESAMTFFVEDDIEARWRIRETLGGTDGPELVAGGPRATRGGAPFYNAAFLLTADAEVVAAQDKRFLIPFAEYFPFGGVELLRRRFGRVDALTPGVLTAPLPTAAGPAGVLVCHEALFPEAAAAQARAGARYLVNLSNDTWHGGARYSLMAFDVARVRAIEQRRALVRASTSGPSGIVAPSGRVVVRTAPFTRDTVAGSLTSATTMSPYARLGDAFAWLCVAVAATAAALTPRRRPRPSASARAGRSGRAWS